MFSIDFACNVFLYILFMIWTFSKFQSLLCLVTNFFFLYIYFYIHFAYLPTFYSVCFVCMNYELKNIYMSVYKYIYSLSWKYIYMLLIVFLTHCSTQKCRANKHVIGKRKLYMMVFFMFIFVSVFAWWNIIFSICMLIHNSLLCYFLL